jgi:CheY-like chemotaxis protein
MRILVIDDAPWNIESAKATLNDHELYTLSHVPDAYDELSAWKRDYYHPRNPPDVLLTDLWLPVGEARVGLGEYAPYYGGHGYNKERAEDRFLEQIPAGLIFALRAKNLGIPAAICTDTDHHSDRFNALVESLSGLPKFEARNYAIEGRVADRATGQVIEKPLSERDPKREAYIKDWGSVLERLLTGHTK